MSFGGITWSWYAVVHLALPAGTCVTPTRNETVPPGGTVSATFGAGPK